MIDAAHRPRVLALLAALDPLLATLGADLLLLAVTVSRVRQQLGVPMPGELSSAARAVAIVELGGARAVDDALDALAELPERDRTSFLRDLSSFAEPSLAPAVDDALAARGIAPRPRFAAVLAISDPARCVAALARMQPRAEQTYDFIEGVSAAHLTRLDAGLPVPPALARMWTALDKGTPPPGCKKSVREAQLKLAARRDPVAALARLRDGVLEVGGAYLGGGTAAVVGRAVAVDRAAAWALTHELRWADDRAFALEGIARVEPGASEIEPTLRALLDEWRTGGDNVDKSPTGAFHLAMPLLATAAHARRADLGRAVIDVLGPSGFEIMAATDHETRAANLVDGDWRPELWDAWIGGPSDGPAAQLPAAGALPNLPDHLLGAWWKLDTLPLRTIPWFRPEEDRLP